MKLQTSEQVYARALRAIGQDLTGLFPERFEIETSGQEFIVRGWGRVNLPTSQDNTEKPGTLKNIWLQLSRSYPKIQEIPAPPLPTEFMRTYTPRDIRQLDERGTARRKAAFQRPDLYSLEERLRMIGRILDEKKVQLVKLSQDSNTVTFDYLDEDGQMHSESCSTLELYKLQQVYSSGRQVSLKDAWQGIRD